MSVGQPRVAVLYDRLRPEERLLFDAFERLGVDVERRYAPHERCTLSGEEAVAVAPVVVQRCVSQTRGLALTRIYEARGALVLNDSGVATVCGDKLATSAALARHGVPTPHTEVAFDVDTALEGVLKRVGSRLGFEGVPREKDSVVRRLDNRLWGGRRIGEDERLGGAAIVGAGGHA